MQGCQGTLIFADGTAYAGSLQKGLRHGYGVCEYSTGVRYEGMVRTPSECVLFHYLTACRFVYERRGFTLHEGVMLHVFFSMLRT